MPNAKEEMVCSTSIIYHTVIHMSETTSVHYDGSLSYAHCLKTLNRRNSPGRLKVPKSTEVPSKGLIGEMLSFLQITSYSQVIASLTYQTQLDLVIHRVLRMRSSCKTQCPVRSVAHSLCRTANILKQRGTRRDDERSVEP